MKVVPLEKSLRNADLTHAEHGGSLPSETESDYCNSI